MNTSLINQKEIVLTDVFKDKSKCYKFEILSQSDEECFICMDFIKDNKPFECLSALKVEYRNNEIPEKLIVSKTNINTVLYILNPTSDYIKTVIYNSDSFYGGYTIDTSVDFSGLKLYLWKDSFDHIKCFKKMSVTTYSLDDITSIEI